MVRIRREIWNGVARWIVRDERGRFRAITRQKGSGLKSKKEVLREYRNRGTLRKDKDIHLREKLGKARTTGSPSRAPTWGSTMKGEDVYRYVAENRDSIPKGKNKHFQLKVWADVYVSDAKGKIRVLKDVGYSFKGVNKEKGTEQAISQVKRSLANKGIKYSRIRKVEVTKTAWIGYVVE